ncbi:MAG: alpha/beta hydrolase [Bacteroidota bacterium]
MPFLKENDISTYYEVLGSGPPLLFIHGLGSSTIGWKYQLNYFSKDYQVICYDIRGHGQSDKPASAYSIKQFSQDCEVLIRSITDKPVHVIGMSLGGFVAFQLALDHPELVRSMCIVNSIPGFVKGGPKVWIRVRLRILITRLLGLRTMARLLSKQLFIGQDYEEIRSEFIEEWAKNDKKAYLNTIQAIRSWSVADQLENIRVPTFMLASELDYTSVEIKKYFAEKMPDCSLLVIKDARHALPVEKADVFNAEVHKFIKSVS